MLIYGINPVIEALRSGRVTSVTVSREPGPRLKEIVELAQARGTPVRRVGRDELDREARGGVHQGVLAELADLHDSSVQDLVSGVPLILVLDGVEDPQNLGAILRTADAAGVNGVIRQTRHAAPLSPVVAKASAGALAHVRIAPVVNIARALDELKDLGVWTVALAGDAERPYTDLDLTLPTAIVVGHEGSGLRRLVREKCDWVVKIPMAGQVSSLNVSVATGVMLFEAVRQRGSGAKKPR